MESLLLMVGMGMVVGAVVLVLNLVAWWQRRTSTFTVDDEDDGRCVACGADGVVVIAPGVYVCGCGHEGGRHGGLPVVPDCPGALVDALQCRSALGGRQGNASPPGLCGPGVAGGSAP